MSPTHQHSAEELNITLHYLGVTTHVRTSGIVL